MLAHTIKSLPRPARIQYVGWVAAGMLMVMLVMQLFTYESFASVLSAVLAWNDQSQVIISAAVIVILEMVAVPFLLNMKLSKLMRFLSAVAAIISSVFWFFTTLTNAHASNSALFGDTLHLPGGIIAAIWSALIFGSVIYVCMWSMRESQPHS